MQSVAAAPLVCLPGLLCDARVFAAQCEAFPGTIAVDGFGERRSLTVMAVHALAAAPPRLALLGHSMGARVALEMWRLAPERIDRLALVSTGIHPPRAGEAEKRHALRDLGLREGAAALVDAWLPPMVAPANRVPALVEPLRRMCIDAGTAVFAAQIEALLARPAVDDLLPAITCPVLVAVGSEDVWSPPDQHRAIAAAIPGARLTVVAGAGHMLPAEAPDELNAAIADWLARPTKRHDQSIGEA
ncbi:alpha/beta fold hydrolase [uncultured Sphingomonas sp.]|uniref:alpha/beta fold hydrolase n=1 Tax=uncultured Sphingomonas sp. TaxID=158754 RepID=UPI0035CCA9C8